MGTIILIHYTRSAGKRKGEICKKPSENFRGQIKKEGNALFFYEVGD
jgi:hypothetical protein